MDIVEELDLPGLLDRLTGVSARPHYAFMVLNLIARAAGKSDSVGPYVRDHAAADPVRDWLSDVMVPMARRDCWRKVIIELVRADLPGEGILPEETGLANEMIAHGQGSRASVR